MTAPEGRADRSERSHYVRTPAPWVAGCSDIGLKHLTNQDALSLAARTEPERVAVIVIADGVSTALGAEVASVAASEAACAHLTETFKTDAALNIALVQAFSVANDAVFAAARGGEPSACTLVAAVVQPHQIAVGSVGDSRAYWIGDDQSCQLLTTDDSMAQARIMLGMSRAEAETSSQAHSLTKWLGRDSTDVTPSVTMLSPTGNGWLLVCSDGLWNYASSPGEIYEVFASILTEDASPAAIVEALVEWAKLQGGRDNITAAVARHETH
ncbi:MAG: protein phosphatase 2C domain-containing protein [Propionibacteriaceae bacterium]|nr:protein phosphatase 2C domain-containing protein [Propionibacteriaceae bacterium]